MVSRAPGRTPAPRPPRGSPALARGSRGARRTSRRIGREIPANAALRAFTHGNLGSYWARVADLAVEHPAEAAKPAVVAWCVLGVSRLHHLLATGTMPSKSGAGRYALAAFGPRWHPIIQEALRAREDPDRPSGFDGEADRRGRDNTAFIRMALVSGLALGP